jgi:hypothetical protein
MNGSAAPDAARLHRAMSSRESSSGAVVMQSASCGHRLGIWRRFRGIVLLICGSAEHAQTISISVHSETARYYHRIFDAA